MNVTYKAIKNLVKSRTATDQLHWLDITPHIIEVENVHHWIEIQRLILTAFSS